ncbi:MAG TPA: ubiquinol-cytochrome c reductase iron-sulfur subunit N-terminal domain-containing protein, partial [Gammaproteobacteria bacterium]|nr:ubiquinol-cytochrome c reductase iron-sulfur subunit N-terminal domain-containing protein [Gammaproteobacteria bacterium]
MSSKDNVVNPERRGFLGKVTTVAGVGGAAAACWPFVNSMNPSGDVLSNATTEVDLTKIPEGGMHTVAWQGKPVFILHRTPADINEVKELSKI